MSFVIHCDHTASIRFCLSSFNQIASMHSTGKLSVPSGVLRDRPESMFSLRCFGKHSTNPTHSILRIESPSIAFSPALPYLADLLCCPCLILFLFHVLTSKRAGSETFISRHNDGVMGLLQDCRAGYLARVALYRSVYAVYINFVYENYLYHLPPYHLINHFLPGGVQFPAEPPQASEDGRPEA